jgi:hypothetical protein
VLASRERFGRGWATRAVPGTSAHAQDLSRLWRLFASRRRSSLSAGFCGEAQGRTSVCGGRIQVS